MERWTHTGGVHGTLETIPADSGVLHPTSNGSQERSNRLKALMGKNMSRSSIAGLGTVGLPQKQTPSGKPRDTQTEALQHGR